MPTCLNLPRAERGNPMPPGPATADRPCHCHPPGTPRCAPSATGHRHSRTGQRRRSRWAWATIACLLGVLPLAAQEIRITPDTVVAGDPVTITVRGLPPDAQVRIVAEGNITSAWSPEAQPALFRSQASFRANHAGTFDLATARPQPGSSYDEPDLRGLFWSMTPADEAVPAGLAPGQVRLRLLDADGALQASAALTLLDAPADITLETLDADFPGALLARPAGAGAARLPVIILLGGSEGADFAARALAPRLAGHGYAVLGLPYHSPVWLQRRDLAALPSAFASIPVDRLAAVHAWLQARCDIDAGRIGIYGVSKGAEFALLAGTRFPWLKAIAAIVPSDVVWEGWGVPGAAPGTLASFAWQGEPLPFVPYRNLQAEFMRMGSGVAHLRRAHDHGRADHPGRAVQARIAVETIAAPVLVAGGMDDAVWASGPMAQNIAERRAAAGLETVTLVFYDAGHGLSGHGWAPTTQTSAGMAMGGSPAGNAAAQHDTWQATLRFFARHLQGAGQ